MGRSDDPFWNEVEDMNDGSMKCKFCGRLFVNGTSISRIKWHLSGERGHGVGICGQVPEEVQEAAFLAMHVGNKRHKSIASSSNVDTCPQEQDNAVLGNLAQGVGPERIHSRLEAANGMENTGEGSFQHVDRSVSPWRLGVDAHENKGEATQRTDLADQFADSTWVQIHSALSKAQKLNEISTYLMQEDEDVERLHDAFETVPRTEQVQHLERGSSCERPSINQVDKPRGDKSIASSSNVNDYAISTGLLEQNKAVLDNLAGDAGRIQAPDVTGQSIERSLDEICNLSTEDDIDNGTRGAVQPGAGASSFGGLTWNIDEIKGDALPTTKLVGHEFEDHKRIIRRWLMNDEVSRIGIYGMGGVGKTTLVTHIYNQLLERPDTFCHVYWITVSQDTSISRLQNSIARCIGLDLSNEDEELHIAVKLSKELMKKQKWVLILDDLWKAFELHKLGVPIQVKGCKLILTTRSKKVCEQMDTQHIIKVKPVSEEEAWTLFIERLGHVIAFSPEVEQIAKSITKECDGLPLGIITMAGTMKGVDDIHEWRNALEDLRQSRVRQDGMEEEVFRILRFSYTHLKDSALQQCLLYCALFPEGYAICRKDLVGYLIDEGVIKGLNSRVAEFDKGYSMLNSLENVCLLERIDGDTVKMHDLIRDMAIQIQQENSPGMFRAGVQLKELPDIDEWTENLTRVSLMQNQIDEIPSSHSPRCPNQLENYC
ncbi:disease resistance protein RPS5-like [Populus nigra]|uniref:disease resistance protein RPS5-like n=1 Tax=Populus nigra TaxID=3691 RepID=UPI002B2763B0|nr:disease resistance protein RPS5-like [Populus nigra]